MLNKAAILPGKISIEVVKESEENPVLWDLNRFSNKDPRSSLYGVHWSTMGGMVGGVIWVKLSNLAPHRGV